MILTTKMLLEQLSEYKDPFSKIKRMCKDGKLFQITKGKYETDGNLDGCYLTEVLYGPSYLSFDYALSRYGLIPEATHEFTCATCQKGKKKRYENHFGCFSYRDVPVTAFPFGTKRMESNGYSYFIATPEKAICDKLYTFSPISNLQELKELLFGNLRIDAEELNKMDTDVIRDLSRLYPSKNVKLFYKYMKGYMHESETR